MAIVRENPATADEHYNRKHKTQNYNTKHSASRHMLLPVVCGGKGMAVVVWLEVGAAVIPIELRNNRMLTCYHW